MGTDFSKSATYRRMVASVMRADGVSPTDKSVFLTIASYANADGSNCRPGRETVAYVLDVDLKVIKRAIKRLKDKGWLTWTYHETHKGRVNLYTLHWAQIGPDRVPPKEMTSEEKIGPKKGPTGWAQKGPKTLLHKPVSAPESVPESIDYDEPNPFNE